MIIHWVVVLEVVRRPGASPVGADVLKRFLHLLCQAEPAGADPIALVADDRYALHLSVAADDVSQAIVIAVLRWKNVSGQLNLDGWEVRRAEVMTRAEFKAEALPLR